MNMRTYTRKNVLKQCLEPIEGILSLCRLCLREAKGSVPIFTNKNDNYTSLATRMMMCLGYEITQEDCLPNAICTECHRELNNYYEFRRKCNRSYNMLKTHLYAVQAQRANEINVKREEQKINLVDNSVCPVTQSVCIVSQPVSQSVSQPISSLVSQSVAVSKDRLILAFDDITQLEFVHSEPEQQNGLDDLTIAYVNGYTDEAVLNKGVENNTQEPSQTDPPIEVCPDVTEFLSSILVEMGILKSPPNEVLMTEECRSIVIETGDSEQITLEIVQIEEEEQTKQKTTAKKIRKVREKTKNDDTKQQKDERARCEVCGRRFASRGVLARHARVHTGERPYRCAQCGHSFSQREVLRRHELVHREVRPHACAQCPKSFTQRAALAAHARRHAPPDARPPPLHSCSECPKVFLHASGLSRHLRAHAGRVFSCRLCARRFTDGSSLRRHVRAKHARAADPPAPLAPHEI